MDGSLSEKDAIKIMNNNNRFQGYLQVIDNQQTGYQQVIDNIAIFLKYRFALIRLSGMHAENQYKIGR